MQQSGTQISATNSELNCDCVKFSERDPTLFCVGQYQLLVDQQQVFGQLGLYQIQDTELRLLDSKRTEGGILDLQIVNFQTQELILSACSNSILKISVINDTKIQDIKDLQIEQYTKCLYLDVYPKQDTLYIVLSLDHGKTVYLELNSQLELIYQQNYQQHQYNVWCCSFIGSETQFISGGEDCQLVHYQLFDRIAHLSRNRTTFMMGQCDITHYEEQYYLTASYDGYIRLWDLRNIRSPIIEHQLEDGVWRVRKNKDNGMLVAAIYYSHKYEVLKLDGYSQFQTVKQYQGTHDSLTYGVDWQPNTNCIVSCSFYDNVINYWKI